MVTRRALLLAAIFWNQVQRSHGKPRDKKWCLSGYRDEKDNFGLARFSQDGLIDTYPLPGRVHGISPRPGKPEIAVAARRPGKFVVILNLDHRDRVVYLKPEPNQFFAGHLAFTDDGKQLLVSANDFVRARGIIHVYQSDLGYKKIGELDSGGIGVHEILVEGDKILTANGGVHTHPDYGRAKLNLPTMEPNFSMIDLDSGQIKKQITLPGIYRQSSIRHLDHNGGITLLGLQSYHPKVPPHSMLAQVKEGRISFVDLPQEVLRQMRRYCGSIRFDRSGNWAVATSPKGGIAVVVKRQEGQMQYHHYFSIADVCGVCPGERPHEFLLTNGLGEIVLLDLVKMQKFKIKNSLPLVFDNHLSAVARS